MFGSMFRPGMGEGMGVRGFFHRQALGGLLPITALSLIKDKPAHGGEIVQSLKDKYEIEAPRAVIYVMLRGLERHGLVVSKWDIGDSGPAKRQYTITEEGLEYLNVAQERLKKARQIIGKLTGDKG